MDRDPLDALIDDAARALTAGEPSPALRARVSAFARAAADRRVERNRFGTAVWPSALGAAAALVIAALMLWPEPAVVTPAPPVTIAEVPAAQPAARAPVEDVPPAVAPAAAMRATWVPAPDSESVPLLVVPPIVTPAAEFEVAAEFENATGFEPIVAPPLVVAAMEIRPLSLEE